MTTESLKERALRVWGLMLRAEDSAIHGLYAEAWKESYDAMNLYQPILDAIGEGEIIAKPAKPAKPAKKGAQA